VKKQASLESGPPARERILYAAMEAFMELGYAGSGGNSDAHDDEDEEKRGKGLSRDNDYGLE
jgi:hypothetical protein